MITRAISWEVASGMMDIAAFIFTKMYYAQNQTEPDIEMVNYYARQWFADYCEAENITEIKES